MEKDNDDAHDNVVIAEIDETLQIIK